MTDPRRQPVYISTDVEFDGPEPINSSLLSIGAVAYREDGKELGRFYANLLPLPDHHPDPVANHGFWERPAHRAAFETTQVNQRDPKEALQEFADWAQGFTGEPVLAAQPLKIEDRWLTYYFKRFDVESPFKEKICMRDTLLDAMKLLGNDEPAPNEWLSEQPYTHNALDDAVHQGQTFMTIKAWMKAQQSKVQER